MCVYLAVHRLTMLLLADLRQLQVIYKQLQLQTA
jgi:hypothetical protein